MPWEPEKTLVNVGAVKATAWFLQNSLDAFVCLQGGVLVWTNETWTTLTGWNAGASLGRRGSRPWLRATSTSCSWTSRCR